MPTICQTTKTKYDEILSLNTELEEVCREVEENNGDISEVKKIKDKLESKVKELKSELLKHKIEQAQEIMKENFLGTEAVQETFGFTPENIPNIPFSKEELEKAKELNQTLIFQEDKDSEGNPITMKYITEKLGNKTSGGNKLLHDTGGWKADEPFFTTETPRRGWKLVSREVLPETTNKNYLEQTEELIKHLKKEVFQVERDEDLPEEYAEAVEEFKREKPSIASIIDSDSKTAGDKIMGLEITKLLRESAPETLYRLAIEEKVHKNNLLNKGKWSWSFSRDSDGNFVRVGRFDSFGALVFRREAGIRDGTLGSVFSRMK